MSNHLEDLICQYYEWQDCTVRKNAKVGRRDRGGWNGELDVVVYDHKKKNVLHFEPSLDADTWAKRDARYKRKFEAGRRHIRDVWPWLPKDYSLEQIAIFFRVP